MLCILYVLMQAIYIYRTTETISFIFLQRIQVLIKPSDSLPKTKREQERLLAIFAPEDVPNTTNGYHPVPERDSSL